jgi:hypothetical protein
LWRTLLSRKRALYKLIRRHRLYLRNQYIDSLLNSLENEKRSHHYFTIIKKLQRSPQKYKSFKLSVNNSPIIDKTHQLNAVTEHYTNFFNTAIPVPPLSSFPDTLLSLPLDEPISTDEICNASSRLTTGKATGPDRIPTEAMKYIEIPDFHHCLAQLFNTMFETNQPIDATQLSYLCPFNKPKGQATVNNLRPISLLNTIRKILEILTLERLRPYAEQYIGYTQSAQRNRSTADIIWTIRYLQAYSVRTGRAIYCLGIDLSKAFDTVDRELLLNIIQPNFPTDVFRLLRYLLANTYYITKIGNTTDMPFHASTGVPQGGALSVALFNIYLEALIKDIKQRILPTLTMGFDNMDFFLDTQFVDDADFYSTVKPALQQFETQLPQEFANTNLKINSEKTERYTLHHNQILTTSLDNINTIDNTQHHHTTIKKLGSNISINADLQHRIQAMTTAFRNLNNIWFRPYLMSVKDRVRLYNVFILPIIRYNLGATAYNQEQLRKLDAHHRRQLRQLLRIFYPQKIHNKQLYNMTNSAPISIIALEQRWKLFGHILRLPEHSPAKQIFHQYHQLKKNWRPGQLPITLPTLLNKDLKTIDIDLNKPHWYEALVQQAQHRLQWQNITQDIIKRQINKYDERRKIIEKKRHTPTSTELTNHYQPWQRLANPQDISTPPGMDYRQNKRSPTTQLPRRLKIKRIKLTLTEEI